jgi:two-component system, LytTR family, sensor kinase
MNSTIRRVPIHLLFWTGIWFLFFYFFNYNSSDRGYVIWFSSLLLPLTMATTYFSVYYIIPRYLFPKKYGRFVLFTFYTVSASAYFIVLIIYGVLIFYKKFNAASIPPMMKNFFFIMILVYLVVILVSFITILNRGFEIEKKNRDLRNKMLTAELQLKEQELGYLKKQIHPHFLFNTLNTIYGLALKKSAHTPEVILRLSNLLDYILYQVDKPEVSLREEVLHIREYIDLERIRFQDTLKVEFRMNEIDERIRIAPMLLIPLVENAFKHGALQDGLLQLLITIESLPESLRFTIENTAHMPEGLLVGQGIGLKNYEKRLELNYAGNYRLQCGMKGVWYRADLAINNLRQSKHEVPEN